MLTLRFLVSLVVAVTFFYLRITQIYFNLKYFMSQSKFILSKCFLFFLLFILERTNSLACSMYKITLGDKTMVGCNEDAWRLTSAIWFEVSTPESPYGAAFTGSRLDGENGTAPQSGMNEYGLSFSRLSSATPENQKNEQSGKKEILNPTAYLKDILHQCKTVEEVQAYIANYDHSFFSEDVFIYIDRSGKYLVVEPFTMSLGQDPNYVLSNFCPSATEESEALQLDRYRNGVEFLKHKIDTTLEFCKSVSDTMHVCREKIGDGTLLTSIWNLRDGLVNLYFYHDYTHTVQFNLDDELAKGNHLIEIPGLFPPNEEFEKLATYKTPQNSSAMLLFVMTSGLLFFFSAIFFLVRSFLKRKEGRTRIQLVLVLLSLLLFYYMFVLARNINVFYFPAPYQDYSSALVTATSYIPFLMLLLIIPLIRFNFAIFRESNWRFFSKGLLTLNTSLYAVLLGLFFYWGFYF